MFINLSCSNKRKILWHSKNLINKGIPMKIYCPDNAKIKLDVNDFNKNITIDNDYDFGLKIICKEINSDNILNIRQNIMCQLQNDSLKIKILKDDTQGFIFKKMGKDSNFNYDFRYIIINKFQQYIFQSVESRNFTIEEIEKMYYSVKNCKL